MAVLEILGGIVELILALGFFAIAALINVGDVRQRIGGSVPQWVVDNAPVFFGVLGLFFLIMAVLSLVLAWGFLKGKGWARTVAIVFLVLSIIGDIIGILGGTGFFAVVLSILLPILIVVYLYRPNVKQWFTA